MSNPIKARYSGTCTRTGQSYRAGTPIVKGAKGWEIAGGAAVTSSGDVYRVRFLANRSIMDVERTDDGRAKKPGAKGGAFYSKAAVEAAGDFDHAQEARERAAYRPQLQLRFEGDTLVCPATGEIKGVIEGTEAEWEHDTLPRLHFTSNGELSHKVGPARWAKIKQFFSYTSYADLADWHDQMDDFDLAEQYEGLSGGQWTLINHSDMAQVENILGILPENRRAEVAKREKEAARIEAEEQERQRAEALEKARIEAEKRAAKKAASEAWLAENNIEQLDSVYDAGDLTQGLKWEHAITEGSGHYSVSWSVATTEDGTRVYRRSAGTECVYYAPRPVADVWVQAGFESRFKFYGGAAKTALRVLELAAKGWGWNGGYGERDIARLLELHGEAHLVEMARSEEIFSTEPCELAEKLNIPITRVEKITGNDEEWGSGYYDAQKWAQNIINGRLALGARAGNYIYRTSDGRRVCEVDFSPRRSAYVYNRWVDLDATSELPLVHPYHLREWNGISPYTHNDRRKTLLSLLGLAEFGTDFAFVKYPDGRETMRIDAKHGCKKDATGKFIGEIVELEPAREIDLVDVAEIDQREAQIVAQKAAKKEAEKIANLRKIAKRGNVENAEALTEIQTGKRLDGFDRPGVRSGACGELHEVKATFKIEGTTSTRTLYRVSATFWAMGEDGDVDEILELHADEAKARESYAALASI